MSKLAAALRRVHGLIVAARRKLSHVRKAAVPIVTSIIGFLSLPELGVDPDLVKAIVALTSTLGVYAATNTAQDPADHKAA